MNRTVFFIILVKFLSIHCELPLSGDLRQEGLIILLDRNDSELRSDKVGKGAVTLDFSNALQAEVPLLVSQSVVVNALRGDYFKEGSQEHQAILQKVIKEIGDFYLFIPQKKLEILRKPLNLDQLKDISFSSISPYWGNLFAKARNMVARDLLLKPLAARTSFISILKKLMPISSGIAWTIFLVGHGSVRSETIADLTVQQFKDLLDFCQQHIKTKLFIYNSCYAGGTNLTKAYQDAERSVIKTYTFPIIVMSITESPTNATQDDNYKKLYETLLKEAGILPDYYAILKDSGFIKYQENMPQIRMPGSGWFTVEGLNAKQKNKDYMIISRTQAIARQKPLEIKAVSRPLGESRRVIFVYTPVIPFPIIIDDMLPKDIPYFCFMLPGVTQYRFKHINADKSQLGSVVEMLGGIARLTPRSYQIYIDELTGLFNEDIFEAIQKTTFKNCIIELSAKSDDEYEARFNGTLDGQQKALILPFSFNKAGFMSRRYQEEEITPEITYTKNFSPAPSLEEFTKESESLKAIVLQKQKLGHIAQKFASRESSGLKDILK